MMEDVGFDFLAKVKRNIGAFKSGGVYWCGSKYIRFDSYYADSLPTSLIPEFTDQNKLLIVRGGIGDLLALSVLCDVAPEVTVITSRGLYHVLDWWEKPPKKKHFNEPIFTVKFPKKVEDYCKEYGQQSGDQVIAQGSPENWYEVIAKSVKRPFLGGRPRLKRALQRVNRLESRSILVVHKATSVNRSAELEAILRAIPAGFNVYWYDEKRKLNGKGEETNIQQYLADLYFADFVISVDTSAIHFREGIDRPALGLYTSFSAASRTKYYTATQSIDIQSPCDLQPCFFNQRTCPVMPKGNAFAPCLSSGNQFFTDTVKKQLTQML